MNEPRTRPASRVICTTNALLPPPTASCCLRKLIVIFPCWCLELRATERVMKSDGIRRRTDASMVSVSVDAGLIRTSSLEYKFPVLGLHLIISIFCYFTLPLPYIYLITLVTSCIIIECLEVINCDLFLIRRISRG